jgi:hypothetical protein
VLSRPLAVLASQVEEHRVELIKSNHPSLREAPRKRTPVGNKREAHEERTPDGDGADGKRTRRE